jgi:hypothetical protein
MALPYRTLDELDCSHLFCLRLGLRVLAFTV